MKIQELVANKPLPPLKINEQPGFCPYCGSNNVVESKKSTTLVGSFGYWDCNHRWSKVKCNDCGKECTREVTSNNEWYTEKCGIIVLGLPSCYESYVYNCKCGGTIKRHYLKLNCDEEVFTNGAMNKNGKWVPHQRTVFTCDKCGQHEMEEDYWPGHEIEDRGLKIKDIKQLKISEEIGMGVINLRGIKKLSKRK